MKLEARAILVPASISAEAEPALARLVGEDGRPLHALYEMPQPDDFSGWMKIKAAADAQYATSVKGLAGNLRAQSSMIEALPAIIHHATPDVISDERHVTIDLHGQLAGVRRRGGVPGERLPPSQATRRTLLRHRLPDAAGAPVPVAARNDDRPKLQ